ncbi:MAG TPA: hypothetical protein VFQ00_04560 [Terriglobales bacterium]|nr:hypothetical protein [Terriglobales bacterium]
MAGQLTQPQKLTCSEIVNPGARLSPLEDFKIRSLAVLRGLWTKLSYMAELRSHDGTYEHWGHRRVHGDENSQFALAAAHSELYVEVLRKPLREMLDDLELSAIQSAQSAEALLKAINEHRAQMIPAQLCGGAPRHFSSVVMAVSLLQQDAQLSTRPTA